jgi:hypothetical protein
MEKMRILESVERICELREAYSSLSDNYTQNIFLTEGDELLKFTYLDLENAFVEAFIKEAKYLLSLAEAEQE